MGTSCVNFHARSEDAAAVAKALARIVHVEALVAPPNYGWITFFDQNASSQDTKQLVRIARSLSKKLQTAVFAFLVHDSDVFRYHLFDRGKLIDQFDSRPDYFGVVSSARRRKYAGQPELFVGLARAGVTVEEIRNVLSGNSVIQLEERRATAFAALFGIDQALAAADYKDVDDNRQGFQSVVSKASPLARALADAVAKKDILAVRAVLERGASPNVIHGHEPLLAAAIRDENLELVQVLREFGAKSEYTLEDGTMVESGLSLAVSQAAHSGRMEILEFLLTESVPPTAAALADALCEACTTGLARHRGPTPQSRRRCQPSRPGRFAGARARGQAGLQPLRGAITPAQRSHGLGSDGSGAIGCRC